MDMSMEARMSGQAPPELHPAAPVTPVADGADEHHEAAPAAPLVAPPGVDDAFEMLCQDLGMRSWVLFKI